MRIGVIAYSVLFARNVNHRVTFYFYHAAIIAGSDMAICPVFCEHFGAV